MQLALVVARITFEFFRYPDILRTEVRWPENQGEWDERFGHHSVMGVVLRSLD